MLNSKINKIQCEHCKKWYSKKSVKKAQDNRMLCGTCRKYHCITNLFYSIPQKKRFKYSKIGNFNMTDTERYKLHSDFMAQGLTSQEAWRKVNEKGRILRSMRSNSRFIKSHTQDTLNKQKQGSEKQKEEFLKGLGMR